MGVGSSRMSGVNNVALWTGVQASPYVPFINIAPIIGSNCALILIYFDLFLLVPICFFYK